MDIALHLKEDPIPKDRISSFVKWQKLHDIIEKDSYDVRSLKRYLHNMNIYNGCRIAEPFTAGTSLYRAS